MTRVEARPPVVLLHSIGTDGSMWRDQSEALGEDGREVLVYDSPGHGGRTSVERVGIDEWVEDLRSWLLPRTSSAVHLVGLSMGGVQALAYTLAHPSSVCSIVLADTFCRLEPAVADAKVSGIRAGVAAQPMADYAQSYLNETLMSQSGEGRRDELAASIAAVTPASYVASAEACFRVDLADRLSEVSVPTLVVIGELDAKTPIALSNELVAGIPGAGLAHIAQAGHLSCVDSPEEFTRVLKNHLHTVESRPVAAAVDGDVR